MFRRGRRKGADGPGTGEPGTAESTVTGELDDDGYLAGDEPGRDDPDTNNGSSGRSRVDLGDPETWSRAQRAAAGPPAADPARGERSGPWDGAGTYPQSERMDFGSLLVPAREGFDIQVNMAEEQGIWIAVVRGESGLQLQAFAAPKTSGLWDEDRQEIADEVAKSGGEVEEAEGPFGLELRARVNPAAEGQRPEQLEPARFLGVDGPRWFLRGVISGPAARSAALAGPLEEIFADVVVVRGDHPAPPRDLLEIQLPEQARAALEAQLAPGEGDVPSPFERGPEITETR
ncbi:MAG TPA: DUF3710 domain-containing protein [Streptosporangiaceae bacterium]|nr:DUF3710 domain-containing protein [Streptosporangiaceae bacterium]